VIVPFLLTVDQILFESESRSWFQYSSCWDALVWEQTGKEAEKHDTRRRRGIWAQLGYVGVYLSQKTSVWRTVEPFFARYSNCRLKNPFRVLGKIRFGGIIFRVPHLP